jgi:hypothetical protein
MSRVWLRAAALAVAAAGVVAGLTIYFSTENVPPCYVAGVKDWRAPASGSRFVVVFPDRAACFLAIGTKPQLVGQLLLPDARDISTAAPNGSTIALRAASGPFTLDLRTRRVTTDGLAPVDSGNVTVRDPEHHVMYVTQRGRLGFRVVDLRTGATPYVVRFKGFDWNPSFGPNPPSHGLALLPDRPELWVLDAPNHALHVYDVSALPNQPPRHLADIRLDRTMTESGSLMRSADGRFVYVGGTGDVIDTQTRAPIAQFDALQHARAAIEVEWVDGRPVFPGYPR